MYLFANSQTDVTVVRFGEHFERSQLARFQRFESEAGLLLLIYSYICPIAYLRLLSNPYENDVTLREQNRFEKRS